MIPNADVDRALPDFDPPLTKAGHGQAADCGRYLKIHFGAAELSAARIFASPLVRTVETAVGIARTLELAPVILVPELADCALAAQQGGGVELVQGHSASTPSDGEESAGAKSAPNSLHTMAKQQDTKHQDTKHQDLDSMCRQLRNPLYGMGRALQSTKALRHRCRDVDIIAGPSYVEAPSHIRKDTGNNGTATAGPAHGRRIAGAAAYDGNGAFKAALRAIYEELQEQGVPLGIVVTHREGIGCVLAKRRRIKYCDVYEAVPRGSGVWAAWDVKAAPGGQ